MDVLIALGTLAEFVTGPAMFFSSILNYAGVSGMIMSFHLLGRYIEAKARRRASQSIRKFLELEARTARILVDGVEKEVSLDEVEVGNVMIIRLGEKIPTEGVVIEGQSAVDEFKATGESMPVSEKIGDEVIGATVNQRGVKAKIGLSSQKLALVGNRKLMEEERVDFKSLETDLKRLEEEAKTAMLLPVQGKIIGTVAVADTLKEDSVWTIREPERMGIKTTMLTGDNRRTAEAIAQKVGISRILAEVLPDQKVKEIQKLQENGETVAMVGDGINDAPALTAANVRIAIGTDIVIESADVTLVRGDLSSVVTAMKLSRKIFSKIKQNLFWAFFYNTATIPGQCWV